MDKYFLAWFLMESNGEPIMNNGSFTLQIEKEISLTEKGQLDVETKKINQFITYHTYYNLTIKNIDELLIYVSKLENKLTEIDFNGLQDEALQEISRLLINAVIQLVIYINYVEITCKGDKKEEFKAVSHNYFDSYFEYRFLYKFRNYISHQATPPIKIEEDVYNDKRGILIDTVALLNNSKEWKQVKDDLEKFSNGININKLFTNAKTMLKNLHISFITINQHSLSQSMLKFESYMRIHDNGAIQTPVLIGPSTEEDISKGNIKISDYFKCFNVANRYLGDLNINCI